MADINVPYSMSPYQVAKDLSACLQGDLAFDNKKGEDGQYQAGPYCKDPDHQHHLDNEGCRSWQLDRANNFFLHLRDNGKTMMIRHRYDESKALALAVFFTSKHFAEPGPEDG